jgi:hypothetical protein
MEPGIEIKIIGIPCQEPAHGKDLEDEKTG